MHARVLLLTCAVIAASISVSAQTTQEQLQSHVSTLREVASGLTKSTLGRATEFAGDRYPREDSPILIAQGDSWYAYPFFNVLKFLQWQHQYRIESVAHNGEWLETMAYDPDRLDELTLVFLRLSKQKRVPRAILLSGGGNDIAGVQLTALLNHKLSGKNAIDGVVAGEILARRLRDDMIVLILTATDLSRNYFPGQRIPIIIHGYAYPIPDGRSYFGFGPWLQESFQRKGYRGDLAGAKDVMESLIKGYNQVLAQIPTMPGFDHVRYVNVTDVLSNDLTKYEKDWGNELHPTFDGFRRVADRFAKVISQSP